MFVGRVLVSSAEQSGGRPARVRILEPIRNMPDGLTEVEVENDPGSDYPLEAGTVHLLAARPGRNPKTIRVGVCSGSFKVDGRDFILNALRNQAAGGPARLIGRVLHGTRMYYQGSVVAGARVVATSGSKRYETVSDAEGIYQILDVKPGRYLLSASKPGFAEDIQFNQRFDSDSIDPAKAFQLIRERREEKGVNVEPRACSFWQLKMDPDGMVSGKVRYPSGAPAQGVGVEIFDAPSGNDYFFLSAITDAEGRYTIRLAPPGDFEIGLDPARAGKRTDGFEKTERRFRRKIHLGLGDKVEAVDLVLEQPKSWWKFW